MEIPKECITRLCDAMDQNYDDKISFGELQDYIKKKELPIEDSVLHEMYEEAISGRGFTTEK